VWEDQQALVGLVPAGRESVGTSGLERSFGVGVARNAAATGVGRHETAPVRVGAGRPDGGSGWRPAWLDAPGDVASEGPSEGPSEGWSERLRWGDPAKSGPQAFQRPLFETMTDRWLAKGRVERRVARG